MRYIELTQNKKAIVDDEDYEQLNSIKWKYHKTGYAVRNQWFPGDKRYRTLRMHRIIMNNPIGLVVDHINGDSLDNRRSNLRVCRHNQNIQNQKLRVDSKSKLKGVYLHKKNQNWCARFRKKHLGVFRSAEEASEAYNRAALLEYGEFARLN